MSRELRKDLLAVLFEFQRNPQTKFIARQSRNCNKRQQECRNKNQGKVTTTYYRKNKPVMKQDNS
jgi:hypothetical protein